MPLTVRPRGRLFWKYVVLFALLVSAALLTSGLVELYFSYRENLASLVALQREQAAGAAARIEAFIRDIERQVGWASQGQLGTRQTVEQRRFEFIRLQRQAPAVTEVSQLDPTGKEQLRVSRLAMDVVGSQTDFSTEPRFKEARQGRPYFGPVYFRKESEPYLTLSVAGGGDAGVTVAEVNLKFIWEEISAIRVGRTGEAFVLDRPGRLVAHPDISLVLRADEAAQRPLRTLRDTILRTGPGQAATGQDLAGKTVLVAMAPISGVDWTVIVKQPLAEAFTPIYTALWRTAALLVAGAALAAILAYGLTRRMLEPIHLLEDGTARIGAGQFDHRINLATGDEFERLATRFNEMAGELAVSQERSERISRLKRFLAPQVAELVDSIGDDRVLDGRRVEVVVVFCDLRGFTAFSAGAAPEAIIGALHGYYNAVEKAVSAHEATLINFVGDGAMILLNAPVSCPDPAVRAVKMASDMQANVQKVLADLRALGHQLGFGVGLAMGPATVGRIGSREGRLDYTAVGNVVNLASRLCSSADDSEILVDLVAAQAIGSSVPLVKREALTLKGFDRPVPVFAAVARSNLV